MLLKLLKSLFRSRVQTREAQAGAGVRAAIEDARRHAAAGNLDAASAALSGLPGAQQRDPAVIAARGLIAYQRGAYGEAVRLLRDASAGAPGDPLLAGNYGEALRAAGQLEAAEPLLRHAVALNPANNDAWLNLAILLGQRGRRDEATAAARRALEANPGSARAHLLVGCAHLVSIQAEEALVHLRRAVALDPQLFAARFYEAGAAALACDWSRPQIEAAKLIEEWAAYPGDRRMEGLHPFLAYQVEVDNATRLKISEHHAVQIRKAAASVELPAVAAPARAGARCRIGYLSADFHDHATMHLAAGMFEEHDRSRFEVFAYSLGEDHEGDYRQRLVTAVEHFADVRTLSAHEIAQRIREDGIDILVDMKGFTFLGRPEVLALRPAPVQVSFLGYPGTLGTGLADYIVTDRVVTPPGSEAFYGESFALLPGSFQANDRKQAIASRRPSRTECGLPEGALVLCSFNSLYKIEPTMFAVWMRILRALPDAVLWLQEGPRLSMENLRREAHARGLDPTRLVFARSVPKAEHLARLANADLFLDTRFINAHTGASDALWAGVPLVTCAGDSFSARVAASVVSACGLPDLVAQSLEEYERLVLSLAGDPARLQRVRTRLAEVRLTAPLFDTVRYTRNLERAFDLMAEIRAQTGAAVPFSVLEGPA